MKKVFQKMSLTVFLLSTTLIAVCTQPLGAMEINQTASIAATNIKGPLDAKEVEAFADPLFADKMKKFNVNGSNFVVVHDGKVIVNKGYGFADKEKKIPVDKDTVFQIGSVTKTFTAMAVLQQVDEGKIDLHHNVEEYLGGLKIPNKTGKPLTMYDMLTYSSGFDMPDITTFLGPQYIEQDMSMDEFVSKNNMPTVIRPPGEVYTYDNTGFLLAGYAVEKASGIPFDEYMDEKVFKPLGMSSSSVRLKPALLKRMAAHYRPNGEPHPAEGFIPTGAPQGSILSTGEDMANYLIMQLQNGKFDGKEIVSQKSIDLMHSYQIFAEKDMPVTTVGFENLYRELANGQHVVFKGGNIPGHASMIVLIPEQKTAFYMSYNNDSDMRADIFKEFMDHYFPEKEKAEPAYLPLSEKDAQKYIGLYQNTRGYWGRTSIAYENGSLMLEDATSGKQKLRMIHPLLFVDDEGNKIAFKEEKNGNIKYFYYATPNNVTHAVAHSQKMDRKETYSDVSNTSSYKTYINNLSALSIMGAKTGSQFDPTGTMTQGEFIDALIKAHGWYGFPGDEALNRQQLAARVPDLNPSAPITRQAAAVMIQTLKQLEPEATNKVKLQDTADAWATDAITTLASQGIVDPDTKVSADGSFTFRAKDLLKRQEASALLDLAFGYYSLPIER
ncbi:serine hydrolase [Brevibacillus fortis]|uniref:Penicillin-binding protein n=1 Tax=Brevibacillus fortis TaxID=2126352 RepID=A0A2P7V882_9BACL|nr:serine hydrolase [Brevibacillus fortis]MED1781408.1 serine hydrolase [Brevibacillus fortis]PSJ95405.1 penicillin-binding protein [Brevibacillus fortis]